ncbi:MAG TPA: cytochrome c oxidase assembly protein [Stellaceae bacterium]|nr:cytochrome c oxidase assembly protein [Stellaceae bacterium]
MTSLQRKNLTIVAGLVGILAAMTTLVAFSVPLYRLFCAATGYEGTTQRAAEDTATPTKRIVTVRFDTQVADQLPWRFEPVQRQVTVHLGEEKLVFFRAQNLSDHAIIGHATFNVTPSKAGLYFNKIQCFCFTDERLEPGTSVDMPVDFFVDPAMAKDPNARDVDTITLSYTFFPSASPSDVEDLSRFDPNAPPDAGRGAQLFADRCAACHALDRNRIGPMLGNVVGRKAASVAGYPYSPALSRSHIDWTAATLDQWLSGPRRMVPGAKMPVRVLEANSRRDLIAYLEQQSRSATQTAGK